MGSDINFAVLTNTQKRSLMRHFVLDLGTAIRLPVKAIHDLQGRAASVTLSAGSLVVGGHVDLPPGWNVHSVSERVHSEEYVDSIRTAVQRAKLAGTALADHPIHTRHAIDVSVGAFHGCFLRGTSFALPSSTLAGGTHRLR